MQQPVLAEWTWNDPVPMVGRALGGLNFIRGNPSPYFSLTYEAHRRGFPSQCQAAGADHDAILKRFPKFADLAALHLADIDGVPMHAEANGWYWYEKAIKGEIKPGITMSDVIARHFRIEPAQAAALIADRLSRPAMSAWCNEQRPRWKKEAIACIAHHDLVVYGDPWEPEASRLQHQPLHLAHHDLVVHGDPLEPEVPAIAPRP